MYIPMYNTYSPPNFQARRESRSNLMTLPRQSCFKVRKINGFPGPIRNARRCVEPFGFGCCDVKLHCCPMIFCRFRLSNTSTAFILVPRWVGHCAVPPPFSCLKENVGSVDAPAELNPCCRVDCHQRHYALCSWCLSLAF